MYMYSYVSVCICKELQPRGGHISCAATFLTSFSHTCSICMQTGSGADMSGLGRTVPDSVSTA